MSSVQKVVLSVVLLIIAWTAYGAAQRAVGRREQQIAQLQHTIDSLGGVAGRLDTVYLRDTVRLRVAVTRWETLRDTLLLSDTVLLTRRETVLVARADTAIRMCTAALQTAELRLTNCDARAAALQRQADLYRRQASPGLLRQITDKLPWIAGAYLIGRFSP